MIVRGKWVVLRRHALEGMEAERPIIDEHDVQATLETPDRDDGHQAFRRIDRRTVIVYYEEHPDEIQVHGVSATRRRLAP